MCLNAMLIYTACLVIYLFIYVFKPLPGQTKVGNTVLAFKTAVPHGTVIMKSVIKLTPPSMQTEIKVTCMQQVVGLTPSFQQ
jgi:hypothetical protein